MLSKTPYKVLKEIDNDIIATFFFHTYLPEHRIFNVRTDEPEVYFDDFAKRFNGIDLEYYKTAMTDHQFRVFKDYIGKESLGTRPSDLEVYYPDEEE